MKLLLTYVPFQVLLGVLLGILFPITNTLVIYGVPFVILVMLFLLHRYLMKYTFAHYFIFLSVVLFGVTLSWFSQTLQNDLNHKNHYINFSSKEVYSEVTLVKSLKDTKYYHRFHASVNQINDSVSCGKVLVEVPISQSKLKIGDVLMCKTSFNAIHPPVSPYDFDYSAYLARQHIYAKIRLKNNFIKTGEASSLFIHLQKSRDWVIKRLKESHLNIASQGLMSAMLLGDKNNLSDEILTSFTNAGVVHIIAISGMHVGVLYFLLLFTFKFVKRFKRGIYLHVGVILLCLWAFAIFSGLSSSVVRSVTMFSFFTLIKLKGRNGLALEGLVCSMLLLLLVDANFLYDVGFQLSYSAVIFIVVFYPILSRYIRVENKIGQYFIDVLLISFIAQLGVLPLSLYYFHQIPLHFLAANFFAVSLLTIVLYGGIVVLIKVLIYVPDTFIELFFNKFIQLYLNGIQYFSSFDSLILKDLYFSNLTIFFYYLFFFIVWYVSDQLCVKRIKQSLFVMLSCQLVVFGYTYINQNQSELLIYNAYKQNLVSIKRGDALTVVAKDSLVEREVFLLKSNKLKNTIQKIKILKDEVFTFRQDQYLVVNKNKPYHQLKEKGMILIVGNNPKINLERLIKSLKPKLVIVDASNYRSNSLKWKSTCKKLQVPFYNVTKQGAYVVN